MESPNLWITVVVYIVSHLQECHGCVDFSSFATNGDKSPNIVLLACFLLHYFHRSIIYPLRMSHCNSMPVSVMFLAFTFCCWNGLNQSITLLTIKTYPTDWMMRAQFPVGLLIFFLGACINISSDYYLLSLKREKERNGVKGYVIPRTGLFEYVSCPNYCKCISKIVWWKYAQILTYIHIHTYTCKLHSICMILYMFIFIHAHISHVSSVGEILEWIGFSIACNTFPGYAFAWFTFANLFPRAVKVR